MLARYPRGSPRRGPRLARRRGPDGARRARRRRGPARARRTALQGAGRRERNVEEARTRVRCGRATRWAQGRLAQYSAGAAGRQGGRTPSRCARRSTAPWSRPGLGRERRRGQAPVHGHRPQQGLAGSPGVRAGHPQGRRCAHAWFTVEGYERRSSSTRQNGKLVTVGRVVDPLTRTVAGDLRGGQLRTANFASVSSPRPSSPRGSPAWPGGA